MTEIKLNKLADTVQRVVKICGDAVEAEGLPRELGELGALFALARIISNIKVTIPQEAIINKEGGA